jgi:hypothetical protein
MDDLNGNYHLAIASDWEYDADFFKLLVEEAAKEGLATLTIWPRSLDEVVSRLESGKLSFQYLFDRASDTSGQFVKMQTLGAMRGALILEPIDLVRWALDKATMHLEFISHGLNTPFTLILPPYDSPEKCYLSLEDLARLGRSFIIKPASISGGGIGVVNGAERLSEILTARQEFKSAKYLLQEKVTPHTLDGKHFWFRGFYTCGLIQCVWWDETTHVYTILTDEEIVKYDLAGLFPIVAKIAGISRLKFFSTEIAKTEKGQYVVIDYVNPSCDMRFKSTCADGIPDEIVRKIAVSVASYVKSQLAGKRHG